MALRLYLDECIARIRLRLLLEQAGHTVSTPHEHGQLRAVDDTHLEQATLIGAALLTYDVADFRALHQENPDHTGIILVYQFNDPSRDMRLEDIVRALANLEASGVPLVRSLYVLNQWLF